MGKNYVAKSHAVVLTHRHVNSLSTFASPFFHRVSAMMILLSSRRASDLEGNLCGVVVRSAASLELERAHQDICDSAEVSFMSGICVSRDKVSYKD